ncbi:hypothetical protein TNCV_942841 [Trichonephila clavipes]|nr:hypothetical protein TNCV_942841 [Trichonephila clavipes]
MEIALPTKLYIRNWTLDPQPYTKLFMKNYNMKTVVCRLVPHNLTEHQNEGHVRISQGTLKLLNEGSQRIISKIEMDREAHTVFLTSSQHVRKAKYGSLMMIARRQ